MKTRKIFALLNAAAMLFSCAALAETAPDKLKEGSYDIINKTGENVVEVKITQNATGDSMVFPSDGVGTLEPDGTLHLTFNIPESDEGEHALTLSFKTESGREESFGTLSIEDVTIELLAADAMTGATPVAFSAPQKTVDGVYTFYNYTGEPIKFLNLIDNGIGTVNRIIFDNEEDFPSDPTYNKVFGFGVAADRADTTLTLQFVTWGGKIGIFNTLKIEEAPIYLLDVDTVSGATPISFTAPN